MECGECGDEGREGGRTEGGCLLVGQSVVVCRWMGLSSLECHVFLVSVFCLSVRHTCGTNFTSGGVGEGESGDETSWEASLG